ncbi:hypothetical protein ACFFMM_31040 [Micromonospora chaiyaphumensis]|uniref:hypothetical protein n=1 Tax=Micromonospora chaiyaphumensis TaxID=307119 RepID=UPI000B82F9BB|nr:hypothetical protein [Micromonospora chaiyaphumensis]
MTALVAAAAVVRAGRRQAGKDSAAGLPARGGTDTRISPFDAALPGHRDGATPAVLTRSAD